MNSLKSNKLPFITKLGKLSFKYTAKRKTSTIKSWKTKIDRRATAQMAKKMKTTTMKMERMTKFTIMSLTTSKRGCKMTWKTKKRGIPA